MPISPSLVFGELPLPLIMSDVTRSQQPKLLDEVRNVLRRHHYSIHTERPYVEWVVRFVRFHGMRSREDLYPAEPKIEALLTDLAVHGKGKGIRSCNHVQRVNANLPPLLRDDTQDFASSQPIVLSC
jgi:hypothetical protein